MLVWDPLFPAGYHHNVAIRDPMLDELGVRVGNAHGSYRVYAVGRSSLKQMCVQSLIDNVHAKGIQL